MVFKGSGRMLSSKVMDEIYSFIVDSNYEHSLLSQLNDKSTEKELKKWLQLDGDDDEWKHIIWNYGII